MRLRALVPLLVLTSVDYVLWDWSIADGHDILSLVAGLTLLPLAAMSLGGLVLMGARTVRLLLGGSSSSGVRTHARRAARGASATDQPQHASTAEPDSPSNRRAA